MKVINSYGDILYDDDFFVWIFEPDVVASVGGVYKLFSKTGRSILEDEVRKNKIFYPEPSVAINREPFLFHCSMAYAYSSIVRHMLIKPFVEINFLDGINENEAHFAKETILKSMASGCIVLNRGKKII